MACVLVFDRCTRDDSPILSRIGSSRSALEDLGLVGNLSVSFGVRCMI